MTMMLLSGSASAEGIAHDVHVHPLLYHRHKCVVHYYYFFMPRYSVPEDLEITNKEKKNYNGCNGLTGSERALK